MCSEAVHNNNNKDLGTHLSKLHLPLGLRLNFAKGSVTTKTTITRANNKYIILLLGQARDTNTCITW